MSAAATHESTGPEFRYAPAPDYDKPLLEKLGQYPRVPDFELDSLRCAARLVLVALVRAQYCLEVHGTVPLMSRAAFLANHRSHLDAPAFLAAVPGWVRRDLVVLAARDYFFARADRAVAAALLAQAVAFDRRRLSELRTWARRLGEVPSGHLLVFPSGSRKTAEPHPGLLAILQGSGWPLVPVAIRGTAEAWPAGRPLWRPFRTLRLTFGAPLPRRRARDLPGMLTTFWQEHA